MSGRMAGLSLQATSMPGFLRMACMPTEDLKNFRNAYLLFSPTSPLYKTILHDTCFAAMRKFYMVSCSLVKNCEAFERRLAQNLIYFLCIGIHDIGNSGNFRSLSCQGHQVITVNILKGELPRACHKLLKTVF